LVSRTQEAWKGSQNRFASERGPSGTKAKFN
jgi:hypothetical protein